MKKRPLSIIIISIIYLLEPVGNLILAAYFNRLPLVGDNGIVHHLIWSDWIILCFFPIVAVGIYRVRKWGWYLFIGFSAVLVSYNLYIHFYINPNYHIHTVILFIIIITGMSAVFLRKHVYAPYFNPRLRWWEVASRYRIVLTAKIIARHSSLECNTLDVSSSGCFVNCDENLPVGDVVWLDLECSEIKIGCLGKVVRRSNGGPEGPGYGIMFHALLPEARLKLKSLVRTLEAVGGRDREGRIPAFRIPEDFVKKHGSIFRLPSRRIRYGTNS